ncbi:MAG TPA: hypothetical protein VIC85_01070 [Ktedonobacterales bacterium]
MKLLPPPALLARLARRERRGTSLGWGPRDLEERQRTMERTIALSEGLLSPTGRRLFRRLAVFVGGSTIEADQARQAGETALARSSHTEGPRSAWLESERDNFLSALAWTSGTSQLNRALWIVTALAHDDIARGSYSGARRRLDGLLAAAEGSDAPDPAARLLAVSRARPFAAVRHDLGRATALGGEQLALARAMGNPRYIADALAGLALLAMDRGSWGEAARYAEEGLGTARPAGDPATTGFALENLALACYALGDLPRARALAEEGLALRRQADFLWGEASMPAWSRSSIVAKRTHDVRCG